MGGSAPQPGVPPKRQPDAADRALEWAVAGAITLVLVMVLCPVLVRETLWARGVEPHGYLAGLDDWGLVLSAGTFVVALVMGAVALSLCLRAWRRRERRARLIGALVLGAATVILALVLLIQLGLLQRVAYTVHLP